jgi:hypothetical protein
MMGDIVPEYLGDIVGIRTSKASSIRSRQLKTGSMASRGLIPLTQRARHKHVGGAIVAMGERYAADELSIFEGSAKW